MQKIWIVMALFCVTLLVGCSDESAEDSSVSNEEERSELIIAAAASLTDAMDEVKEIYEEGHPDTDLTFNFAGSGTLAQQIEKGAPVDAFISANEDWMQLMIDEGFVQEDDRKEVTGNKLVLIGAEDDEMSIDSFSDLDPEELKQVAIGNPESVPAGEYTEEILHKLNKWDELEDSFVYAKDVRQVLTYVETGNTEVGFVYESDALISDKVDILSYSDPANHDPIIYPGAVLEESENRKKAESFLAFLRSDEGQEVLEKYGFTNEG